MSLDLEIKNPQNNSYQKAEKRKTTERRERRKPLGLSRKNGVLNKPKISRETIKRQKEKRQKKQKRGIKCREKEWGRTSTFLGSKLKKKKRGRSPKRAFWL